MTNNDNQNDNLNPYSQPVSPYTNPQGQEQGQGQQPPSNPGQQPWGQQPPSNPGQQPWGQQPPVYPGQQPPSNPGQMAQPQPQQPKKGFWQRQSRIGKFGIGCGAILFLMVACGLCSSLVNATSNATQTTAQTTATSNATQTTQAPVTPTPTQKPKPTPTPKPTQSPAQLEDTYKAKCVSTTVTDIDKNGSNDKEKNLHFTATIVNFVKDGDGNTAGANVDDPSSGSSSVIQIVFMPGTDISKINQGDTVEVWGMGGGVASGKNAFGGDIQEAWVQVAFINDQTTGYQK